jgi:hypothetical protein
MISKAIGAGISARQLTLWLQADACGVPDNLSDSLTLILITRTTPEKNEKSTSQ